MLDNQEKALERKLLMVEDQLLIHMSVEVVVELHVRYSARPCPKGCFLSAGLPASFVPTMVITEESASLRLFTESRIIAIELVIIPTKALKADKKMLAAIPIILVRMMICSRFISTSTVVEALDPP